MPYLTLDSKPSQTITVTVEIPDGEEWLAVFMGALLELANERNWENFGDLLPSEMAAYWDEIAQGVTVT